MTITLDKFTQLTTPLIGLHLSQLSYSYGDVLVLHFGKLTNYIHSKLSDLQEGEWQLVIKISNWVINCEEEFLINQPLTQLTINTELDLKLIFMNDKEISLFPNTAETELPYWELWMPGDYYIVASHKGLELRLKRDSIN